MNTDEDEDEKSSRPSDKYEDFSVAPIVIAEDGGPAAVGSVTETPLVPKIAPDNFQCIIGPCRHYWHLITLGPDGGSVLKQHSHTCMVSSARENDLGDDCVFECNLYDPIGLRERWRRKRSKRKADKARKASK